MPMRTAQDVIRRCFWDAGLNSELIRVGYLDRLAGGVTRALAAGAGALGAVAEVPRLSGRTLSCARPISPAASTASTGSC